MQDRPAPQGPNRAARRAQAKRRVGKVGSAALAVGVFAGMLTGAPAAQAADDHAFGYDDFMTYVSSTTGETVENRVWVGSFNAPAGSGAEFAWCVEIEEFYNGSFDFTKDVTGTKARQANYIIEKYQGTKTNVNHAAISYAVHQLVDADTVGVWESIVRPQVREAAKTLGEKYLDEAVKFSGPYTLGAVNLSMNNMDGVITDTGLKSSAGNTVTDFKAKATLSGPGAAHFDGGGSTKTFTPGDSLDFTATAEGNVRVDIEVEVPGNTVTRYISDGQDVAITGGTTKLTGDAYDAAELPKWQPQATSTAVKKVQVGGSLNDVIHPKAAAGQSWGRDADGALMKVVYNVDVYGPFQAAPKEQNSIPAG